MDTIDCDNLIFNQDIQGNIPYIYDSSGIQYIIPAGTLLFNLKIKRDQSSDLTVEMSPGIINNNDIRISKLSIFHDLQFTFNVKTYIPHINKCIIMPDYTKISVHNPSLQIKTCFIENIDIGVDSLTFSIYFDEFMLVASNSDCKDESFMMNKTFISDLEDLIIDLEIDFIS